ncbi:MaoC family dehydratase [Gimibacter soli]|uniref:MaoC family dehydratase n=1 Tax=Gimibacter soli TaxID=3024400 RepID=A0AAE9XQ14_9PROT|nr:MaoC family dehydratase [Gimibacter soli]WCL55163.1 MaoC family dehydratase [Gimibacter soli]
MFKIFLEDLVVGSVETFGSYEVTRDEVIEFASKYDPQPFHLDEEMAKKSVFGTLCASGWHTCAMTMSMMVKNLMGRGTASMGSPGVEQLRWRQPVKVGEVLSVRTTVLDARPSETRPNLGLSKSLIETLNQKGEVVMDFTATMMILRRPTQS